MISHRPWDYHPDHRYVGVLVQDAAYMVTVPFFCPDTPPLTKNPVFLFSSDRFQKPYPFAADIAVSLDDVIEQKCVAVSKLVSQVFEGGANGSQEFVDSLPPAERPGQSVWTGFATLDPAAGQRGGNTPQGPDALVRRRARPSGEVCRGI